MPNMPLQVCRICCPDSNPALPHNPLFTTLISYRHKKCVENTFPECGACMRLNLVCLREPKQHVAPAVQTRAAKRRTEPAVSLVPTARTLAFLQDYEPRTSSDSGRCSMRQYAMKYYVNVMTQLLTVSHQFNSFLSGMLASKTVSVTPD